MNQQISDFVRQARASGMADDKIRESLKGAGWPDNEINEALSPAASALAATSSALTADEQAYINKHWSWGGLFLGPLIFFLANFRIKEGLLSLIPFVKEHKRFGNFEI